MAGVTLEEKFQFDLEGYLVVPGLLGRREVERLNELADEVWTGRARRGRPAAHQQGLAMGALPSATSSTIPASFPTSSNSWGRSSASITTTASSCAPAPPAATCTAGPAPQSGEGDHWYRYYPDGTIRTGLTVFTWNLSDCGPGDGGFACIPGSHKTNLRSGVPREVMRFERPAHYVRQPPAKAGDVIIFTEALIHGTLPWTAGHERRALLYKYSPGHSSWSDTYYDPADYPGATEQQVRIMAPPSVGRRPDSVQA